jgi:hypothetical protein
MIFIKYSEATIDTLLGSIMMLTGEIFMKTIDN